VDGGGVTHGDGRGDHASTHNFEAGSSNGDGERCLGRPRIHGELMKLGFTVSERTVSRYLPDPNSFIPMVGECS